MAQQFFQRPGVHSNDLVKYVPEAKQSDDLTFNPTNNTGNGICHPGRMTLLHSSSKLLLAGYNDRSYLAESETHDG